MINKPSLLDTPNLINMKEYTPSPIPGESVDDCYAWDSLIRGDYNTGYTPDWDEGKLIQETLPAAQWDAFIHDLTAYGWETTQLLTSLWEEMYCLIHGSTVGYDQEAVTQLLSGAQTFTNKTISFADNTLTGVASTSTAQTLTNKTISFDDNTLQNVASLDTAQTLKNKTIDSQYNTLTIEKKQATVTCLPTVYSTSQTVTPTKEMNIQIDTAAVTLTLGTGPYIGYTVPVTATASCSVTYTGANGVVTDSFDAGQTINYIWKGSYWGSVSNASLPVFINSSQTVSPTMDMNYVISTASVNLSLDPGARIGHKIAVTATADGAVTYLGVNGPTTQAIGTGYRCELTWNGSYWLMTMFSVIEGIDAAGSPFQFGGEVSVAPVPTASKVIDTDGDTLDPEEAAKFILDINVPGATCVLDSGATVCQHVEVININANTALLTYNSPDGATVMSISQYKTVLFTWNGTSWSAVVTESMTGTNGDGQAFKYDGVLKIAARPSSVVDYSTSETLTGALWIDGKPIYRKVYTATVGKSDEGTSTRRFSTGDAAWDGETLVNVYGGYVENWSNNTHRSFSFGGSFTSPAGVMESDSGCRYNSGYGIEFWAATRLSNDVSTVSFLITAEYTKTTD